MLLAKLTKGNSDKFFDDMRVGVYFTVASTITPDDLHKTLNENGIKAEYCEPGSKDYYRFGASAYRIASEDISALVHDSLAQLNSIPDRLVLVKGARFNNSLVRSATRIVFSDNVRRRACSRKILNHMLTHHYIEKQKQFRKKSDIWYYYGITGKGRSLLNESFLY